MTFIYFILVLGITIFIHEFGHFIFAKRAGIYVYEFSLGMGPQIFKWHRQNDETTYSIRLFPIGGFVQMAGEEVELDKNIPADKRFQAKSWLNKMLTVSAGILFNFLLAIFIFFIVGLINGAQTLKPIIYEIDPDYPLITSNLKAGDTILKVDGKKVYTVDHFLLEFQIKAGKDINLTVRHLDDKIEDVLITPKKVDDSYVYGFSLDSKINHNFFRTIGYAIKKFLSLLIQMFFTILYLFTGKLSIKNLAGPVGIFSIVGQTAKAGLLNLIYLIGYLSINVGVINLLPIPAFDGGRLFFLIIEKIKGSPVNPKFENTVHAIGMLFLLLLMAIITYQDIIRLFS